MALSRIDTTNMIEDVPQSKLDNNINFRNIIINGSMDIAQRGTSKSSIGFEYGTVDRFQTVQGSLGAFTQSQSTDVPTGQGFSKSLKMDCTTADASPSSGDELYVRQMFEGQNLQYLLKGTSSAKSLTVSFWVKSNKTGTYIVELFDSDNSRHINKSYTISSSDTWEKKTITYDGDTTGAFNNDNAASLHLAFMLGAGSNFTSGTLQTSWGTSTSANRQVGQVNLADSTSNEWYITGVQLEAGTTASDFEFLPVDVNLRRCQRYYFLKVSGTAQAISVATYYTGSSMRMSVSFPVTMRSAPSIDVETVTNGYQMNRNSGQDYVNTFDINAPSLVETQLINDTQASGTAGQAGTLLTNSSSSFLAFNSEL